MANPFTSKTAGSVSPLDLFAPDVAQEQRRLGRRQQLADLLFAQAIQPVETQTQTVGGWAVPNNAVKPFEKLASALIARRSQDRIDERQGDLAKRYAEVLSKGMQGQEGKPNPMQAAALAAAGVPKEMIPDFLFGQKNTYRTVNQGDRSAVVATPERGTGPATTVYTGEIAASPDALLGSETTRRGQDMTQSTALSGQAVTMRGQDLTQGTAVRGQDLQAATTQRGQDLTAQTAAALASPEVKGAQTIATEQAKGSVERSEKQRALDASFQTYETAIKGLVEGLDAATTGPLAGRIPALSSGAQKADGAVAAMAPVLKDLFRSAGEGVFTDRDQALLLEMIPQRTDLPEARQFKLDNIDRIVRAKLKQGASDPVFNTEAMPAQSEDPLGLR